MTIKFHDRTQAGQWLARRLTHYANHANILVIALPRGGVPIAFEVAKVLNAPLDFCLVRKLGVPNHSELAMGAIAIGGVQVLNRDVVSEWDISRQVINQVAIKEMRKLQHQDCLYRSGRPRTIIRDRTLILVDDGIATGATIRAAITMLQKQQPQHIIVAAPVIESATFQALQAEVEDVVCLITAKEFSAISFWYVNFRQITDEEVLSLLERSSTPNQQTSIV